MSIIPERLSALSAAVQAGCDFDSLYPLRGFHLDEYLTKTERVVVELLYGLENNECVTRDEAALRLHLMPSSVYRIWLRARRKLINGTRTPVPFRD